MAWMHLLRDNVGCAQVARGEALCQVAESEDEEPLEDEEEPEVSQHALHTSFLHVAAPPLLSMSAPGVSQEEANQHAPS